MNEIEDNEYIPEPLNKKAEDMVRQLGVRLGEIEQDEVDSATREQLDAVSDRVTVQRVGHRGIRIIFANEADRDRFDTEWLAERFQELRMSGADGLQVDLAMREESISELQKTAVDQAKLTIGNRIDAMGVAEATVIARDTDLIIEVPGATQEDFDRIRDIVQRTARLEFKVLDEEGTTFLDSLTELPDGISVQSESAPAGETQPSVRSAYLVSRADACGDEDADCRSAQIRLQDYIGSIEMPDEEHELIVARVDALDDGGPDSVEEEVWRTYYVYSNSEVTGEDVDDAFTSFDPQEGNRPVVSIQFNSAGATKFGEMTGRNVKRRMAIVLDDVANSAPVIQTRIDGGRAQITLGSGDYQKIFDEANDLVVVLRAGALPAPLRPANEQLIGPTLGRDAVAKGAIGATVGIGLVLLFMAFYYQVAGIVADLMVLLNLLFMVGIMAGFEATLTLPGVAALALTVGMAVDANVLITERIREEIRAGKSPRSAVDQGFKRAFWSVVDSQITTFIAGVVLFQYGTGPIKGFAVMLMIGICTSLFTGIFCSRVCLDLVTRGFRVKRLRVG